MTRKNPHPLEAWAKQAGKTLYALARDAGIPFRSLYYHVDRKSKVDPKASTIIAVEDATGGEVTAQEQINWIRQRNK